MKYGSVTLGQLEAAINKIGGENALGRLLSGELIVVSAADRKPAVRTQKPKLLIADGYYSAVELKERHDPNAFYQTREGLYIYGDFQNRIVAAAKPTEAGAKFKRLPRLRLGRNTTGDQLRDARPNAIWQATEFCPWLAAKLSKQPKGETGELLNTGWATLFLVEGVNGEVFLVNVRWRSVKWNVDTWDLGDGWLAGYQFVPRN